jgi:hypothetical protein
MVLPVSAERRFQGNGEAIQRRHFAIDDGSLSLPLTKVSALLE